jgi:hypothetical protein
MGFKNGKNMTFGLESYKTAYKEASLALAHGEPHEAFQRFRQILEYPGNPSLSQYWQEALELFAQIAKAIAGGELAYLVRKVAYYPNDINALYDLGYELMEYSLPAIAATFLARAHEIAPDKEEILLELVSALETIGFHAKACQFLRQVPQLLAQSFFCRYLLAFNSIMIGDLEEPHQLLPSLQHSYDPTHIFMSNRIKGMLQRAQTLNGVSCLDSQDLRGWHFVLTASILLHLSPYGFSQGMYGRYAYIHDSYELIREGIERLIAVLKAWKISIPRVFSLPDTNSAILAHAVAQILSCSLEEWSPSQTQSPGLIVAYDLARLEPELLSQLQEHRPSQVLWSHASCSTQEMPLAADVTTYLYQINAAPWEPGWGIEIPLSLQDISIKQLADRIVNATVACEALHDLADLVNIAHTVQLLTGEQGAAALVQTGQRLKQWVGSPVPRNDFITLTERLSTNYNNYT